MANHQGGAVPANDVTWIRKTPIAHRGLHDDSLPENSMPAFEAAAAADYAIELDVHLSADNRLIVMHDDDVNRMTGQEGRVSALDSAALAAMRLGGTTATVPLLDDVLRVVNGRVPVLVEVKPGSPMARTGPELVRLLSWYRGPAAVQSFDPRVLLWLRKNAPDVVRGQLSSTFAGEPLPATRRVLLRTMALNVATRPAFLAYKVEAMPSPFVALWRRVLRVPLVLWTVRTPEQLAQARRHDANVIFEHVVPR